MNPQLQVYSAYSLLKSTMSIETIVDQALKQGVTHLALTDRSMMTGCIVFVQLCRKHNIHPIIGLEVDLELNKDLYPFILYAKNMKGYQALIKISSAIETNQSVSIEEVSNYKNDLFLMSAGMNGIVERLIIKEMSQQIEETIHHLHSLFKDSYLLVLQNTSEQVQLKINRVLIHFSKKFNISLIATNPTFYAKKEDALGLEVLLAIKDNRRITDSSDFKLVTHENYMKSAIEMKQLFEESVIKETIRIANLCHVVFDFKGYLIPKYDVPGQKDPDQYLRHLCFYGIKKRLQGNVSHTYVDRLEYELKIIHQMGFDDYFLIVYDFILFAKKNQIMVGPGRGSSAGSLVAYALGIIDIDPIKYDLLFERFLNPERISMPDIDVDFPSHQRDDVIQYVKEKYGKDHVAHIITFGTFKPRLSARDVCRVMNVSTVKLNQLLKYLPRFSFLSLQDLVNQDSGLRSLVIQDRQLKRVYQVMTIIANLPKNISTHAAGIVIAKEPLETLLPVRLDQQNQVLMTQFDMKDVERIGLLKMDFLGIQNLTIIAQVVSEIQKTDYNFKIQDIPLDDHATFQLLSRGDTTGIFQLESSGVRSVLKQMTVTDFEDIVAAIALYRPGPMDNIPSYIKRKHKQEAITYPDSSLETVLSKTYGIIVYQEQIMQIAQIVGGFSLAKADILRRAMSKKNESEMLKLKDDFLNGAASRGYQVQVSQSIFDDMFKFANYGFNRSHAVAYGLVAYQMAYLKTRYPLYFMAEILTSQAASSRKFAQILVECRRLGIEVRVPSINYSEAQFTRFNDVIYVGFTAISGIGVQTANAIITCRNGGYLNFFDFVAKTHHELNEKTYESIIDAGALDEFGYSRSTLRASLKDGLLYAKVSAGGLIDEPPLMVETIDEYHEDLDREKNVLGVYLSSHPLANYEAVRNQTMIDLQSYQQHEGKFITSLVYVPNIKLRKTIKTQAMMATLTIQDEWMEGEGILYPKAYQTYQNELEQGGVYIIQGKVDAEHPCKLIINQLKRLN